MKKENLMYTSKQVGQIRIEPKSIDSNFDVGSPRINMLHIEKYTSLDWFSHFTAIEDFLEKSLLLVAILVDVHLITEKESGLFK